MFGPKGPRTVGVYLTESEIPAGAVVLNGNTIDGAGAGNTASSMSAAVATRIIRGVNATIGKVRNDILMGGINVNRYGVYELETAATTCHPVSFTNHDLFFSTVGYTTTDVLYHYWNGTTGTDLTTTAAIASQVAAFAPLLNVDPKIDATFHLIKNPASPCINAGTTTEAPGADFEGDARPQGGAVDIGNDEAQ